MSYSVIAFDPLMWHTEKEEQQKRVTPHRRVAKGIARKAVRRTDHLEVRKDT